MQFKYRKDGASAWSSYTGGSSGSPSKGDGWWTTPAWGRGNPEYEQSVWIDGALALRAVREPGAVYKAQLCPAGSLPRPRAARSSPRRRASAGAGKGGALAQGCSLQALVLALAGECGHLSLRLLASTIRDGEAGGGGGGGGDGGGGQAAGRALGHLLVQGMLEARLGHSLGGRAGGPSDGASPFLAAVCEALPEHVAEARRTHTLASSASRHIRSFTAESCESIVPASSGGSGYSRRDFSREMSYLS